MPSDPMPSGQLLAQQRCSYAAPNRSPATAATTIDWLADAPTLEKAINHGLTEAGVSTAEFAPKLCSSCATSLSGSPAKEQMHRPPVAGRYRGSIAAAVISPSAQADSRLASAEAIACTFVDCTSSGSGSRPALAKI